MLRIKEVLYTIPSNHKSVKAAVKSVLEPRAGLLILLGALYNQSARAEDFVCTQTAYFCTNEYVGSMVEGNKLVITTTVAAKTAPLAGFGVYLQQNGWNAPRLWDLDINTTGKDADAIRSTSQAVLLGVNNDLKIVATGSSADGINLSSDTNNAYDGFISVKGFSDIKVTNGIAVRANNFQNASSNSVITLLGGAKIAVTGGGTATNDTDATGYAVYAGNRNKDSNGLGTMAALFGPWNNTLGSSYVFVGGRDIDGNASDISTTASKGHAVYANKGGLVQLGDGAYVHTSGTNAYALYAATEGQLEKSGQSFSNNNRAGYIYLAGGLTLRAEKSDIIMQANGEGSIIANKAMDIPVLADDAKNTDRIQGLDKTATQQTAGTFDIVGTLSAINGGEISLNMTDGSHFSGAAQAASESVINLDIAGASSVWEMTSDSILSNLTLNDSMLKFSAPTDPAVFTAKVLTVTGDYTGNGSTLQFNTVLGDDTSATDKLVVQGDTAGHTNVQINNIGGTGALTANGIELIEVQGNSAGTFGNDLRIVAGAYDYFVKRGDGMTSDANNWYLKSDYSPTEVDPGPGDVDPGPGDVDPGPGPGGDDDDEVPAPPPPPPPSAPVYRPEVGSYLANLAASNTMFITRLHDRLGETQYTDVLVGEQKVHSFWLINEGGHNRFRDGSGQLHTSSNRYVTQAGTDIAQWSMSGSDRFHLGVMAGYGNSKSKTRSQITGYEARSSVSGYNVGIYGTWYANQIDKSGMYLDSWAQYSWFTNTVTGKDLTSEQYKSKGLTTSAELGYTLKMGENAAKNVAYFIQPKAQVTLFGVKTNDHTEANGTKISAGPSGDQIRLGLKAFMNGYNDIDKGKDRVFQAFVEANWVKNTKTVAINMDDVTVKQAGATNIAELKIGVEGQINKNFNLWGNISQQIGDKGYSDTKAIFGVKYSF